MRASWFRAAIIVSLAATALAAAPALPHAPVRQLVGPLWTPTASELTTLDRGLAIVKTLPASTSEEITFIGAIQINAPASRFVERFRDIERLDGGRGIPRIKRLSQPATPDDVKALELNAGDLKSLRACTPGECALKLPSTVIARFQREVDWNAPDAATRANKIVREMLLDRLAAYQRDGDRALQAYHDHEAPLSGAESTKAVLARDTLLGAHLPQLLTYVKDFPRASLPGAEDFYFWADVEFGLKPTLRLSHVTIYRAPPNQAGIAYAIVTKQLYASHYFQSAVEVRFLVEEPQSVTTPGSAPRFYLVCWINARSDGMTGMLGPIIRLQVRRKSRTGVIDYLERVKSRVEGTPTAGV